MHERREDADIPEYTITIDLADGKELGLTHGNTMFYQDDEHSEMTCVIHAIDDETEPLYLFGSEENMNSFVTALRERGFQQMKPETAEELAVIKRNFFAWRGKLINTLMKDRL